MSAIIFSNFSKLKEGRLIYVSDEPPDDETYLWLDVNTSRLMYYYEGSWRVVDVGESGSSSTESSTGSNIIISSTPPSDITKLWFDTTTHRLKYYDAEWKTVDAETILGVTIDNNAISGSLWTSDRIVSDINALQQSLNVKADKEHTHQISDITDYIPSIIRSETTPNRTDVLWYDTTENCLKFYDRNENIWKPIGSGNQNNSNNQNSQNTATVVISDTPPNNTSILWFDLNTNQLKYHNGQIWASIDVETIKDVTIDNNANANSLWTSDKIISELNTKANIEHTHDINDINDLTNALDNKANINHNHTINDINNLQNVLDDIQNQVDQKAPIEHEHQIVDIQDLQNILNSKSDVNHNHTISDIENLETTLNNKADSNHSHVITDINGLENELNQKASIQHQHQISDIQSLQEILDSKSDIGHSHSISEINNLQSILDTKADINHTHTINDIADYKPSIVKSDIEPTDTSVLWFDETTNQLKYYDQNENKWKSIDVETIKQITVDNTQNANTLWTSDKIINELNTKADIDHTHSINDIDNLQNVIDNVQTQLDQKADIEHTHQISDIQNLQETLDSKADSSHTHTVNDIVDYAPVIQSTTEPNRTDVVWYNPHTKKSYVYDPISSGWKPIEGIYDVIGITLIRSVSEPSETNAIWHNTDTDQFFIYSTTTSKWKHIRCRPFGYANFDNNISSSWLYYISIPIETPPNEEVQYKIEITSDKIRIYSNDLQSVLTEGPVGIFWDNFYGHDLRVFDEYYDQNYFWIEYLDLVHKHLIVWIKINAGQNQINLAFGNDDCYDSSYDDPNQVFIRIIDGLVGCWHFDKIITKEDGSKWALDSSGNDFHGKVVGAEQVDGYYGKALKFDGVNDYVALPLCYSRDSIAETTVCAWVKSSSKDHQIIVSFDRSEVWRFALKDDGRNVGWDTTDSSEFTHDFGTSTDYTDGNWHFICGWYKAGSSPDKKIYVDGAVVVETTAHGGKNLGGGSERSYTYGFIGVGSEASSFDGSKAPLYYFNGLMDEVMIFHKALSDEEIQDLYQYGGYGDYNGKLLVGYKRLDQDLSFGQITINEF